MSPALYAAFVGATIVLMLIPGPNVALIVAQSMARGRRAGLLTVAGTASAMVLQLAVTSLGVSEALGLAARLFDALRWVGVAYLVYLGLRAWNAPPVALDAAANVSTRATFLRGFLVSLTNPKTLAFYAAFLPQFIDPRADVGGQMAVLSVTFVMIALIVDSGWALLAARLRGALALSGKLCNRLTGAALMGAGLGLALARRS